MLARHSRSCLILALALLVSCSGGAGDDFSTYTDGEGNVWVVSDCPDTDQALRGNPDGLPNVSSVQTREEIEAWLGDRDDTRIIPRNGEVWERTTDGTVRILQAEDFMVEVTIDDAGKCPGAPASVNGVPFIYRVTGD